MTSRGLTAPEPLPNLAGLALEGPQTAAVGGQEGGHGHDGTGASPMPGHRGGGGGHE